MGIWFQVKMLEHAVVDPLCLLGSYIVFHSSFTASIVQHRESVIDNPKELSIEQETSISH